MLKKKIMVVFGTRPEAIKMGPVVKELESRSYFDTIVCVTGQHKEMLKQVLDVFDINPKYNLNIMKEHQSLFDITTNIINKIQPILIEEKPDLVLVHGDTSTTFVTALCCYYLKIPVGHVEAGLRTYDIYSPYPEEFNRQAVSLISKFNFAPTELAKQNLINEGKDPSSIYITGNTAIDALKTTVHETYKSEITEWSKGYRLILLTAHRRENIGEPMKNIFKAVRKIVDDNLDVKVVYPIHLNPQVREIANSIFNDCDRIKLIEPLDVLDFHNLMNASYLIMSDSGGIQEEAPSLHKPVLVLRDVTERPEGVNAGTLLLVGTNETKIINETTKLLNDKNVYNKMANAVNPYGDGMASVRIADAIRDNL